MGQDGAARRGRPGEEAADIFLPAPRNLRQQLSRAAKALEEEQYSEAVDLLGQLLASRRASAADGDGSAGAEQDYFLAESEAAGTQTSLKSEAQRMLGSMPDKGRELYELKFGADARQMLERALDERDFPAAGGSHAAVFPHAGRLRSHDADRAVLSRPGTTAGRRHAVRAAGGQPAAAQQYEPELSVLLATCWLLADMPDRARETLVAAQDERPAGDAPHR